MLLSPQFPLLSNQSSYAPKNTFDEEDIETNTISGDWQQQPQPQGSKEATGLKVMLGAPETT